MSARGLLLAALLASSCGSPSEEEIQAQFDAYVNGANQCTAASDCALATADCPLGCFVAVRADRKSDVEAKARDLIKQYERGGMSCEYECVSPGVISCTSGRCAVALDQ